MPGMDELYQNVILEHNRSPRNFRMMDDSSGRGDGNNPLCGDRITVWLKVRDGVIEDASFQGAGCAISRASASLMTAAVRGKREDEAERLFDRFQRLVTGRLPAGETETLGKLAVFSGVSQFPIRVKCATLCWHAMKEAMAGAHRPAKDLLP
jgi:nitrogen fixation protein NifU and related proteins